MNTKVIVYTDGACSGNPGPGGWAFIIITEDKIYKSSGCSDITTNNRMELTAVIKACEKINEMKIAFEDVCLYSDSKYFIDSADKHLKVWKERGWRKSDKKEILNKDLWEIIYDMRINKINLNHVKGHSGNKYNEEVDFLATQAVKNNVVDEEMLLSENEKNAKKPAPPGKKSKEGKKRYISYVNNLPAEHDTWQECQRLVSGVSNAKYKSFKTEEERDNIKAEWGLSPESIRTVPKEPSPATDKKEDEIEEKVGVSLTCVKEKAGSVLEELGYYPKDATGHIKYWFTKGKSNIQFFTNGNIGFQNIDEKEVTRLKNIIKDTEVKWVEESVFNRNYPSSYKIENPEKALEYLYSELRHNLIDGYYLVHMGKAAGLASESSDEVFIFNSKYWKSPPPLEVRQKIFRMHIDKSLGFVAAEKVVSNPKRKVYLCIMQLTPLSVSMSKMWDFDAGENQKLVFSGFIAALKSKQIKYSIDTLNGKHSKDRLNRSEMDFIYGTIKENILGYRKKQSVSNNMLSKLIFSTRGNKAMFKKLLFGSTSGGAIVRDTFLIPEEKKLKEMVRYIIFLDQIGKI